MLHMAMPDPAPPAPGPYLQTVSGRWVNPFDPDPAQLDAGDIARALANQCRFGGHSRVCYSVAQHSVIVSELVEQRGGDVEDVFAALMHDASEAYLGDMPHPLKHRSPLGAAFKDAEDHLERTIRRSSAPTARCSPPSAAPSAPRRGTGRSSRASSRWTSTSSPCRPTTRPARSLSVTPSWTRGEPKRPDPSRTRWRTRSSPIAGTPICSNGVSGRCHCRSRDGWSRPAAHELTANQPFGVVAGADWNV